MPSFTGYDTSELERNISRDWEKLIAQMYDLLQDSRSRGGTLGHKTGFYYAELKKLYEGFLKVHTIRH